MYLCAKVHARMIKCTHLSPFCWTIYTRPVDLVIFECLNFREILILKFFTNFYFSKAELL